MALPSLSFLAGLLALAYLASFVIFAFIRVTTGVSIQRVGYSGLRRIAYTPRDGIKIELRGLGLTLHRPTFAQPTWISVVLTELKVTVDLKLLETKHPKRPGWVHWPNGSTKKLGDASSPSSPCLDDGTTDTENNRSRTWERLTQAKEKIKRLHRKVKWIRLVDLVATSSSLVIVDVGSVQVSHVTMAVDTRRKTVDRSRLFHRRQTNSDDRRPAEWIFTVRSILFTPDCGDSTEILDHCTLNVYGYLYKELDGLRDASIALKLGRLSIPYDDIHSAVEKSKRSKAMHRRRGTNASEADISFSDVIEELDQPGSREENIVRTVSDSKEFVASILRGIQEIQFAVSFFALSKRIQSANATGTAVWLNVGMKEVGLDLLRLDPRSPAHLQYFSRDDVAHQALIAAIAVSVGVDDGQDHPERLLYIPMATATVRTTLPSKTIQYQRERNVAERNANILSANLVATSPSLDLDPKHLPLVLDMLQRHERSSSAGPSRRTKRHLISKLLPKANIKFSIHEPVTRVALPPMGDDKKGTGEFDLLISTMSNVSLDVESSHSAGGELHYSLSSNFRVQSHQLYYQTASGEKHNLLLTESLDIKVQLSASPEIAVIATGDLQTFSVYMVRPEITEGIRQIVSQLRSEGSPVRRYQPHMSSKKMSFLRRIPPWFQHLQFTGSDFSVEIAGIDPAVSENPRGVAVHLDSWNAEYKANREENSEHKHSRRRALSRTLQRDEHLFKTTPPTSPRKNQTTASDGRRLAFHVQGFEGFVVESADTWEPEPFMSVPRFETAFSTSTDHTGPIFHIHSFSRSLYFHYSLYRHFCIGVATLVLRKTFSPQVHKPTKLSTSYPNHLTVPGIEIEEMSELGSTKPELTTIDIKAAFVQLKAAMPADPPLMIQLQDLEAGRHRWTAPFARSRLVRLYADTPRMPGVWSRIVSIKGVRVDLRRSRRKSGTSYIDDKSVDIVTDAIRLAVPHQLVMHKVFDNFANLTKTVQQLHHRFKTGGDEDILDKDPEKPKQVPKISLRSQAVLFEIEDGSFEWKLGVIYRLGLLEQKQRLAREEAFRLKKKKLEELAKSRGSGSSKLRAKSANEPRGRIRKSKRGSLKERSKSEFASDDEDSPKREARGMRYDIEGKADVTGYAQTDIEEAKEKLQRLNAQTWKKRIDQGLSFQTKAMKDIRSIFWGLDEMPDDGHQHREVIMSIPQRPALMALLVSDFSIVVEKPSFPIAEYAAFLHRIGKGIPFDQKYSLLIPMHVQINMGEARITLRDYPLPLIHVPAIRSGQSPRLPGLSLKTDFVIGEEYQDSESMRYAHVVVVPTEQDESGNETRGFSVKVPRTVSPVKTYSDMKLDINTSYPTRITWGTSYQPAIQDMMQVIESFTKPAVDPSERVGFWDKIRLTFHSRIKVAWKGDGDVHLILKGSRDPYMVTGHGAGFVMCWRNDVRWSICEHDDPRKFMTVESGNYVLAIPDLSHYARVLADPDTADGDSISSGSSYRQQATFKKTIMKLSGKVQWLAGLVFERNTDGRGRSFDFIPHYKVVLKNPKYAKCTEDKVYDAFKGFRSNHIHLSLAIAAPHDRDWSVANLQPSSNYNSVHLTPRFFSHFFSWWSMFSGVMSLPIRQGKIWPGIEKSSKKFGRHLATIKYNLLLSPLFMSHIYKHKNTEGPDNGVVSATGLKVRLDSFMLDLHQRREEFRTAVQGPKVQGNNKTNKTTGMRINEAQLDFIAADIRAISAVVNGPSSNDLDEATDEMLASYQTDGASTPVDLSNFTIPDKDLKWIDMDDFVELDWMLPSEATPQTQILPLAFAPRFTYFRQTDHQGHISGDPNRHSPFGKEPTHFCVMSAQNDPRAVQRDLVYDRLQRVKEQLGQNDREIGEHDLKNVRGDFSSEKDFQDRMDLLKRHSDALRRKRGWLESTWDSLDQRLSNSDRRPDAANEDGPEDEYFEAQEERDHSDPDVKGMDSAPFADYISDFNNRFIVHNVQLKWSNSLRNIILRYIHEVSQRRGFVYYMSRKAVKFILDIVEEQSKSRHRPGTSPTSNSSHPTSTTLADVTEDPEVQDRIQQLVDDVKKVVKADESEGEEDHVHQADGAGDDIALDYTAQNSYHVRLIAPQIQLQSEKNKNAAVLVTAKGMQLKIIQIMDKERVSDSVSGLVQRRFSAAMDSLQMFVTNSKTFSTDYLHMYSGNRYGASHGSSWPPWVPFEVMFEFELNPYGFQRVVQRTSASLRYDKYNTLRLKYNDDVTTGDRTRHSFADAAENRMDHLWIEFPQLRAICDSAQYYSLYIMVLDLLLYNEPLEKTRSERLEKIMLASDFSDLSGAPEMVIMLQERIRQLEEIKTHFQINEKYLDRQGWKDRLAMEKDLSSCEDELFFMMKAITTSQRRIDDRMKASQSEGILRWYIAASDIVWHLVRENNEPLAEFQLKDALYDRTDNNDGSNYNNVEVGRVHGLNLLPNALYPEMISPYIENEASFADGRDTNMIRVHWLSLEPIARIPVMSHFEVNLFPLKVQLEKEIGMKLFEYVFPKYGKKGSETTGSSPFMVRNMLPSQLEEDEDTADSTEHSYRQSPVPSIEYDATDDGATGAGSLELRLQPTLTLTHPRTNKAKSSHHRSQVHGLGLFKESSNSGSRGSVFRSRHHEQSSDTLTISSTRPSSYRSPSIMSSATASHSNSMDGNRPTRFKLTRVNSGDSKKETPSDDLTQMMARASNYMTLAYVKIPSLVLCLSYKGKGQRNFEDVHDLVFRMPTLEYRNKTWSNLDLALQLKKDVTRALISHTGAIIGNKFSHHRPSRQQQSKLRQIANSSALLSSSAVQQAQECAPAPTSVPSGPASSISTPNNSSDTSLTEPPRRSFTSGRGSIVSASGSYASSLDQAGGPIPGEEAFQTEAVRFADELGRIDPMEPETIRHTLSRHLTTLSQRAKIGGGHAGHGSPGSSAHGSNTNGGHGGGADDDDAKSAKMKTKLLLGKKFLGRD